MLWCDNDLIPLLFPPKTTIWSWIIFCIGVCIVLLHFISPFDAFVENVTSYVTLYLYACWCYVLCLPDLYKVTTYLLTCWVLCAKVVSAPLTESFLVHVTLRLECRYYYNKVIVIVVVIIIIIIIIIIPPLPLLFFGLPASQFSSPKNLESRPPYIAPSSSSI